MGTDQDYDGAPLSGTVATERPGGIIGSGNAADGPAESPTDTDAKRYGLMTCQALVHGRLRYGDLLMIDGKGAHIAIEPDRGGKAFTVCIPVHRITWAHP